MTKFSAKYFNNKTAVKAIIFSKDKRVKTHFVNPEHNSITIQGKTYTLNDQDWFISEGFPTYVFNDRDAEPQNPLNPTRRSLMTADDFNVAISSKVAREIFDASNPKMDAGMIGLILSVITLIGVGVVGYLMSENFTQISQTITEIREVLRLIGGQ